MQWVFKSVLHYTDLKPTKLHTLLARFCYTFRLVQVMFINLLLYIQGQFLTIACSQQVRTTLFPIYLLHTYTVSSSRLIWTIANESKISHSRSAMLNRNITYCQAKLPQNQSYISQNESCMLLFQGSTEDFCILLKYPTIDLFFCISKTNTKLEFLPEPIFLQCTQNI